MPPEARDRWLIRCDVGGTFTDCIAYTPTGELRRTKVLSSGVLRVEGHWLDPVTFAPASGTEILSTLSGATVGAIGGGSTARIEAVTDRALSISRPLMDGADDARPGVIEITTNEPAPVLGARLLTGTPPGEPLPRCDFRLATTRATNALLERKLAPTALIVTRGFRDLLRIGDQRRPDLFALDIVKPPPLTELVYEISARRTPDGSALHDLDETEARDALSQARDSGAQCVAIALMHAWANPEDERRVVEIAHELGFEHTVASAELSPRIGLLERARTAVVDAGLRPVLSRYLTEIESACRGSTLRVLTSAGGLRPVRDYSPADALLSGPGGGAIGAAAVAHDAGFERVISFDMGGTSTDVARIETAPEVSETHTVGDAALARPAIAIETVAAGGGSICAVRDGRPCVGPGSAGADPGPACYGAGGPLTITDAQLLLGRLDPAQFQIPVDPSASKEVLEEVRREIKGSDDSAPNPDDILAGFLELANERMAEAIRRVSVRRGYDPSDHTLVAFGGAGPQHACDIARLLGIRTVLVPRDASLLSAVGLHHARPESSAELPVLRPLQDVRPELDTLIERVGRDARTGFDDPGDATTEAFVSLRLVGQNDAIEVPYSDQIEIEFANRYEQIHAVRPDRPIELVSLRAVARSAHQPDPAPTGACKERAEAAPEQRRVHDGNGWSLIPVRPREALRPDEQIPGPTLITEHTTTTWVPRGWDACVDTNRCLVLRDTAPTRSQQNTARGSSFARELTINRLTAIAEQMGEALRRAAVSTNVKERRDYSCAVLDPEGRLVSGAPHIPVHLGALGACARAAVAHTGPLAPGDAVVTNHPRFGGSHLPDITLIQGAFAPDGTLLGYVASRAHHAEIGGSTPGSMPPGARTLMEEGVPIEPLFLFKNAEPRWDEFRTLLAGHEFPSRSINDNLADVRAAWSAGRRAADAIEQLAANDTTALHDAMSWIIDHTASLVRSAIEKMNDNPRSTTETLDDGSEIRVAITPRRDRLVIDFAGTSPTHPGNLNAPLAVTRSAVAYVIRLLIDRDIPLNEGLLEPIDLRVPEGCMLNPRFDDTSQPAVAAGNVETSQRVVECLVRALGICAASQGTMNNLLLGNETFGYYETICGGAGATPRADGASAIHTHMTNTAITDAEVIEQRHPLRLLRFAIRENSGGDGRHHGGDGVVRDIQALESLTLTLITQRRASGAPGFDAGGDGTPGDQRIVRIDSREESLAASDSALLSAGDRIVLETPGGGGWGTPERE